MDEAHADIGVPQELVLRRRRSVASESPLVLHITEAEGGRRI